MTLDTTFSVSGDHADYHEALHARYNLAETIDAKAADYTITEADRLIIASAEGTVITLPENATAGAAFTVKREDADYRIIVERSGADTIDGESSWLLSDNYASLTAESDGADYHITEMVGTVVSSLSDLVLPTFPIAYWQLNDAAGSGTAADSSGNALDGTATDVVFGATGIGDGSTAATFNGATSVIDIYSAALNALFDGSAGSLLVWFQVTAAGVWTDAVQRRAASFAVGDATRMSITKSGDNNMQCNYRADDTQENVVQLVGNQIWHGLLMTWRTSTDVVRYYYDGTTLTPSIGLGAWAGNLNATRAVIGAYNTTPTNPWSGNLAHIAVWDRVLTAREALALSRL